MRHYETSLLDVYHQTLPFWHCKENHRILALLGAYDNLNLLANYIAPTTPNTVFNLHMYSHGLVQALRWCKAASAPIGHPAESIGASLDAAYDFLTHAYHYSILERFHQSYGRGLVECEINPASNTVRFKYKDWTSAMLRLEATADSLVALADYSSGLHALAPDDARAAEEAIQAVGHYYEHGFLSLAGLEVLNSECVTRLLEIIHATPDVTLRDNIELGGYTIGELKGWWRGLWKWAHAAEVIHCRCLEESIHSQRYPTQVVSFIDFVDRLCCLSGLDQATVKAITARLTYNDDRPRPDVFLQPLIIEAGVVQWSTRVVLETQRVRNHLKLMSRTPAWQDLAANIIGGREPDVILDIRKHLEKHAYSCQPKTDVSEGGDEGAVDRLARTSRARHQVLVVEVKAVLAPEDENEQNHVTQMLIYGQGQIKKVIDILKAMPFERKTVLFKGIPWKLIEDYYGIVMTEQSLPTGQYDHAEIPACSLRTIMRWVHPRDLRTPKKLRDALVSREWMVPLRRNADGTKYHKIEVGEVTYELPIAPGLPLPG